MQHITRWAERWGGWYLTYLALVPAIGTFTLYVFGGMQPNILLFTVVGTAAVGIYLATTEAHTLITKSAWRNALMLLDTPIWMAVTVALGGSLATAIISDVLIEIAGGLLGVLAVVFAADAPTRADRRNAAIAVGIPLLGAVWLFRTYAQAQHLDWQQLLVLAGAMLQAAFVQFKWGIARDTQREVGGMVAIGIVAWILALWVVMPMWFYLVG